MPDKALVQVTHTHRPIYTRLTTRRSPAPIDRTLVRLARNLKTNCRRCGWHTNPEGCCNSKCRKFSGVPF